MFAPEDMINEFTIKADFSSHKCRDNEAFKESQNIIKKRKSYFDMVL
jgi:hypothetical protein